MAKIGLIFLIIISILLGFLVLTIFDVIPDFFGLNDFIGKIVDIINIFKIK